MSEPRTTDELAGRHAGQTVTIVRAGATHAQAQAVTGPRILIGAAFDQARPDARCTYWIPGADAEPRDALRFHLVHRGRAHLVAICADPARQGPHTLPPAGAVAAAEDPDARAEALATWLGAASIEHVGAAMPEPSLRP